MTVEVWRFMGWMGGAKLEVEEWSGGRGISESTGKGDWEDRRP